MSYMGSALKLHGVVGVDLQLRSASPMESSCSMGVL